jgi:hypothetical protein
MHIVMRNCAVLGLAASLAACGGAKEDALRTVKSFQFASCESTPTTDPVELEAIREFKRAVESEYFVRQGGSLFAANHESDTNASGLREYDGPIYIYVHHQEPTREETAKGIDWSAMIYLHARKVRTRTNFQKWGEWQSVRTRNFTQNARSVDGLGRWKCLMGSEIAWASVQRHGSEWTVVPLAVGVYEAEELARAVPTPSEAEIKGSSPVSSGSGGSGSDGSGSSGSGSGGLESAAR